MFTEHGAFHIELKGNLLFIDIEGAWNLETALTYQKAFTKITQPLIGKPWGVITFMSKWELCTPDSEVIIFDMTKQALANGVVREAIVNNKGVVKLQLFEKFKKTQTYKDTKDIFARKVFEEKEPALKWLASEGFSENHQTS